MNPAVLTRFCERLPVAFAEDDPDVAGKGFELGNVDRLVDMYRAVSRGDLQAVLNAMTEDVELDIVGSPMIPWTGHWQGREEVLAALGRNLATIDSQDLEVLSLTAQGDIIVVTAREQGVYLPTGRPYDVHWVQIFTYHQGKIRRVREIFDSAALLPVVQG
jgi:uncharacterized protein